MINVFIVKNFYRNVRFGNNITIKGFPLIRNNGKIYFGNNLKMNSNSFSNPIGGNTKVSINIFDNGNLVVGNNVHISNVSISCANKIVIEDDVFIGGNVKIYDTDFHSLNFNERINNINCHSSSKEIIIKKGAFIGAHAIILKGVTIGEESIIAAGSIVTKTVPSKTVYGGNPARFIKKL